MSHLVVGLGNPGKEYALTRHNAGFMAVDSLVSKYDLTQSKDRFDSVIYKGQILNSTVLAIKPLTFMNNSGKAVIAFANFFKIEPENIIVLYDDLDLEPGKVKLKSGGGDAGHNGIRSINRFVPNKYLKIRIGIGHPGHRDFVSDYVLSNFKKDELEKVQTSFDKISALFDLIVQKEYDLFSSKINM